MLQKVNGAAVCRASFESLLSEYADLKGCLSGFAQKVGVAHSFTAA
jgi:hypothetical protein